MTADGRATANGNAESADCKSVLGDPESSDISELDDTSLQFVNLPPAPRTGGLGIPFLPKDHR